jgi:hypothetical protein
VPGPARARHLARLDRFRHRRGDRAAIGTLRELYGSLVPLGVATDAEQEPIVCPGRDQRVSEGDRVTLLGTREELAAAGIRAGARRARWFRQTAQRALGRGRAG